MDPRTEEVVQAMRAMFPEALADRAWDNVGLLLANTATSVRDNDPGRVLLTNDLTSQVVDEAIDNAVHLVITYHPIIFRGLKSITLDDPQQASLIRLAQNNIAVYSPHTALDAAPGGINDWLAAAVTRAAKSLESPAVVTHAPKPLSSEQLTALQGHGYRTPVGGYISYSETGERIVGYGRHVSLGRPTDVRSLVREILLELGLLYKDENDPQAALDASTLRHALVVRPRTSAALERDASAKNDKNLVSSVAVCAGSGADILRASSADLLLTGEMSHHDALAASAQGKWVVCLLHSNSERLFLQECLQLILREAFSAQKPGHAPTFTVSKADCDPFEIWDLSER